MNAFKVPSSLEGIADNSEREPQRVGVGDVVTVWISHAGKEQQVYISAAERIAGRLPDAVQERLAEMGVTMISPIDPPQPKGGTGRGANPEVTLAQRLVSLTVGDEFDIIGKDKKAQIKDITTIG